MFALAAARELAIAILIAAVLGSALGSLSRREDRATPIIHDWLARTAVIAHGGRP